MENNTHQDIMTDTFIPMTSIAITVEALSKGLERLVEDFDQLAIPDYGRYVQ